MAKFLSSRVKGVGESVTLKLNEAAQKLQAQGEHIYNLTAGQLPVRPLPDFVRCIESELNFLKSYQYAPVLGVGELRKKIIEYVQDSREVDLQKISGGVDAAISNGAKHSIYNVLGTIVDPGDEVILFTPYWVSYPEMVKFWGGVPIEIEGHSYNAFIPPLEDLKRKISHRTKAIILNVPNNPAGIYYPKEWMQAFGDLLSNYPEVYVISDEIYYELAYYDPKPSYYYQTHPQLLDQTIIIDGISKSLACTGLRIGYAIGPKEIIQALGRLQGQTTSGASSLIQNAILRFDFLKMAPFLDKVKEHLRRNAGILRESFRVAGLAHIWYQSTSAFYYMVDFAQTPLYKKMAKARGEEVSEGMQDDYHEDLATEICSRLLSEAKVATIPGTAFGVPNAARLSLVLEEVQFRQAMEKLTHFLTH